MRDKIQEYVEDNPIETYIDSRDELSEQQVDRILAGNADEVKWDIELSYDGCCGEEYDFYWKEMCDELGCTMDDVEDWLESDGFFPSHVLDDKGWERLLSNTTVNIVGIVWEAEWNFGNWAYGGPVDYSDVKDTLKLLGVNPKEFRENKTGQSRGGEDRLKGWFPDLAREPKINPQDLWDNMIVLYDGVLHFCLGDLAEVAEVANSDSKHIVFTRGTNIVFYDRGNGAGITDTTLTEDLVIPRKMVEFRNDTNYKYGVQSCYGFVQGYWTEGGVHNK